MSRIVFDIEANGLLRTVSQLHCIATYDIDTQESKLYGPGDLDAGVKALSSADLLIGHNICGYDIPALGILRPDFVPPENLIDTLVLGCILYPDDRVMSLEAWAKRLYLKQQKVENEDWSVYTEHMGERCQADVSINNSVYKYLIANDHIDLIGTALGTEQQVSMIHAIQAYHGVSFDVAEAISLLHILDERIEVSRTELMDIAPWHCMLPVPKIHQGHERAMRTLYVQADKVPKGTCVPFKKDGTYNVATKKYFGEGYKKVRGAYTKMECKPLNPDSSDEVKELLLTLGWIPMEYNYKKDKKGQYVKDSAGQLIQTSPKLTEESYDSLPPGLGKQIAEYNTMNHRRNFLLNRKDSEKGALAAVKRRGDGKVSADAFTCGTNTGRYRHSGTVCNIPRPSSPWGPEVRSLFTVSDDMDMVGVDLSGIEARCLAHYLLRSNYKNAKKTAALILSPDKTNDFHSFNAIRWGVSRDIAKNTLYALMYGAGAKKLAQTAGKPEGQGAKLKRDFYKAHPGIEELITALEEYHKAHGYLQGLDGRPLYIRSNNKLLNTLLQNAAAIVFKRWMIRISERLAIPYEWEGVHQIIAYHDELQFECPSRFASPFSKLVKSCAIETGKELKIKVPIGAEAKVGKNWRDTH